jgi:hypothetical protein
MSTNDELVAKIVIEAFEKISSPALDDLINNNANLIANDIKGLFKDPTTGKFKASEREMFLAVSCVCARISAGLITWLHHGTKANVENKPIPKDLSTLVGGLIQASLDTDVIQLYQVQ